MKRRHAIRLTGAALAAVPFSSLPGFELFEHKNVNLGDQVMKQLDKLKPEPACRCEVRMERGGARLYLNGKEEYPLLAVSSSLLHTATAYRKMGIRFLHPLIGMEDGWIGPGRYNWTRFDKIRNSILDIHWVAEYRITNTERRMGFPRFRRHLKVMVGGVFKRLGTDGADMAVKARRIIEHLDVIEQARACLLSRRIDLLSYSLDLQ